MSARCAVALLAGLATFVVTIPMSSSSAYAQEDVTSPSRESAIDEKGPVVRRKLLYRSTRLEINPMVAFSVSDPFSNAIFAGANIAFHLTNEIGFTVSAGYGLAHLRTSLSDGVVASTPDAKKADLSFSKFNLFASLEASWVPAFGKFSLMNGLSLNWDLHLNGGVGFFGTTADPVVEGTTVSESNVLNNTTPAPVFGGGVRLYFSDLLSLNIDIKDFLATRALIARGNNTDAEIGNNLLMSVGVSIFLPGEVKVSR